MSIRRDEEAGSHVKVMLRPPTYRPEPEGAVLQATPTLTLYTCTRVQVLAYYQGYT